MAEPQQDPGSGVALNGDRLFTEGGWMLVKAPEMGLRGKQTRYSSRRGEGPETPKRSWRKQTVAAVLPRRPKDLCKTNLSLACLAPPPWPCADIKDEKETLKTCR